MKELKFYQCEICFNKYGTPEEAFKCESKGIEEPLAKVGDFVSYYRSAIEGWDSVDDWEDNLKVMEINQYGHSWEYVFMEEFDNNVWNKSIHYHCYSNEEFMKYCTVKDKLIEQ